MSNELEHNLTVRYQNSGVNVEKVFPQQYADSSDTPWVETERDVDETYRDIIDGNPTTPGWFILENVGTSDILIRDTTSTQPLLVLTVGAPPACAEFAAGVVPQAGCAATETSTLRVTIFSK